MSLAADYKSDPPGNNFYSSKERLVNRVIFYFLGMKVRPILGTAGITYLEADSLIGKKYRYISSASERQNIITLVVGMRTSC
jgi:hypothetical protein